MLSRSEGRVLTPEQAAELLNVSRRWLMREGVAKSKVPCLRVPGSNLIRFLESDLWRVLESWRDGQAVGTPPKGKRRNARTR